MLETGSKTTNRRVMRELLASSLAVISTLQLMNYYEITQNNKQGQRMHLQ